MPVFSAEKLAEWSAGEWDPVLPERVDGVSNDTRTLRKGNLYFALKGETFDGHDFVSKAFDLGASGAVVSERRAPASGPQRPLLKVGNSRKALREIGRNYRQALAPEIIAVTGSVGKSTVKEMTAQVLSRGMATARTKGNWNNEIGLPLSLLAMEPGVRAGVFEIGMNHPGEIADLCTILKPDWGVVTNVGPVHVEFFGSVEEIAREKASLLRSLPPGGVAVLESSGPFFKTLRSACSCRILTVSAEPGADYVCTDYDAVAREFRVAEKGGGETVRLRLNLPGFHNAMNALFAVAVARKHGMPWEEIRAALEAFIPLPMRWEVLRIGGRRVVNDAYNANPLSMRASLRAFEEEPAEGKKWIVLGGMLELGCVEKAEHLSLGATAAKGAWAGLITVGPLGDLVALGAEKAGFEKGRILKCGSAHEAAGAVAERAGEGDAVLLKASRGMHFEAVVEQLRKRWEGSP